MGSKIRRLLGHEAGSTRRGPGQRRRIESRPVADQSVDQRDAPKPLDDVVERQATYAHSPAKVWRALTDATKLSQWLHPVSRDIDPVAGARFAFYPAPDDGDAGRVDCRVVDAEPGRRLSYTWKPANDEPESVVTWTLEPIDGGTRVHLRHDGVVPARAIPLLGTALATRLPTSRRSTRRRTFSQQSFRKVLQWQ